MTQAQRNKKAEQLRLAARIIETGCEWEVKCGDSPEWLGDESPFVAAYKGDAGAAVAHGYEIRIKEPVIPVPEGWRELRDDEKDGRWVEGAKWLSPFEMWKHCASSRDTSNNGSYAYAWNRIIVPVAKPKKRVPLGAEDVPPGSVVRKIKNRGSHWNMVAAVSDDGVKTSPGNYGSFKDMMDTYEIKRPTDTEWQPCSKEAES